MNKPHLPVLLQEVLEAFSPLKIHRFIDGTLGAGGHAAAILKAHPEISHYMGLDKDETALELAKETLKSFGEKIYFYHHGFERMEKLAEKETIDGILLDVGVSSMQLDKPERGFSFSKEGPLDMRMDQQADLTSAEIVNTYSEKELGEIFYTYGEERRSRACAKAIVKARMKKPLKTTIDLVEVLNPLFPYGGRLKIHPVTRIFQALRIAVNDELKALEGGICAAFKLLKPKGRLIVISFHSLEDRIVKHLFKRLEGGLVLTKKPIIATSGEARSNPRSRSAKLRVIEKLCIPAY
ncbi:MAG: 16S rRNA (cytosine(1402)-N(4))-methyltransferase RsmH [Chlamydiia bacterium]|nr:16S rRNA (cytosine(1402)-N(4))-methyltransferase RsmH [Chlamydiia bacterium]